MTKQRELTKDGWDQLLTWLDDDPERAAERYENIRHSLIKILSWSGCHEAEDLADEVINRVANKVPLIAANYQGDPANYFYGVAKKVLVEWQRKHLDVQPLPDEVVAEVELAGEAENRERLCECLKKCLQQLGDDDRRLILRYYQENKQAKIDLRKQIAIESGISLNFLRVKVYRIRAGLQTCIERCLREQIAGEID